MEGRKSHLHYKKYPERGNVSSIPLSEENCWNTKIKNSKPQPPGHQGLKS
jgi:hypothetical protein